MCVYIYIHVRLATDVNVPAANAYLRKASRRADIYVESYIRKKRPGGTVAACLLAQRIEDAARGRKWMGLEIGNMGFAMVWAYRAFEYADYDCVHSPAPAVLRFSCFRIMLSHIYIYSYDNCKFDILKKDSLSKKSILSRNKNIYYSYRSDLRSYIILPVFENRFKEVRNLISGFFEFIRLLKKIESRKNTRIKIVAIEKCRFAIVIYDGFIPTFVPCVFNNFYVDTSTSM